MTIVHLDGKPAKVTYVGFRTDVHGPVYSFGFEGDRVPYACREGEQIECLMPIPKAGDLATLCFPSDRYPAKITHVTPTGKVLKMVRLDRDLNVIHGATFEARWSAKFNRYQNGGLPVSIGHARYYQAPEV